jgi:hypothetical protein
MERRTGIYRRYLKALDTFKEAGRSDTIAEVRPAHSLSELARLETMLVLATHDSQESEHLMVVQPPPNRDARKFFCSGWARKAGIVQVPALEQ